MKKHIIFIFLSFIMTANSNSQLQWQKLYGLLGNSTYPIIKSQNNRLLCYNSDDYFLYSTINNGLNWLRNTETLTSLTSLLLHNNTGCLYAGLTSSPYLRKSTDNGETWQQMSGYITNGVYSMAYDYFGNYFYATSNDWLNISTNIGVTWSIGYPCAACDNLATNSSGHLFLSKPYDGIYRSTQQGYNLVKVGLNSYNVECIFVSQVGNIFAGTTGNGLWKSINNGDNWSLVGLPGITIYTVISYQSSILVGTNNGILKSTDNGQNWNNVGYTGYSIKFLFFENTEIVYAGFSNYGIFKSDNFGSTWTQIGLPSINVCDMEINNYNTLFCCTYQNGIYKSTNNGTNWVQTAFPNLKVLSIDKSPTGLLGICCYNGVYLSSNGGDNWSIIGFQSNPMNTIRFSINNDIYLNSGSTIFKSTNLGLNWSSVLTGSFNACLAINSLGYIFVGSPTGLFRSTNNGSNWNSINNNNVASIYTIGNKVFIGTYSSGIFRSDNNGETWIPISTGLPEGIVNTFSHFVRNNQIYILASVNNGIYKTTNDGTMWYAENIGLDNTTTYTTIISNQNFIFVGSNSGLWISSQPTNISKVSSIIPEKFSLSQNYPNPFNPVTNIKFDLLKASAIKLIIYDVQGKEVKTLVNENLKEGSYRVDWNASQYPSGVYFYRMETENFKDTKRMILIK